MSPLAQYMFMFLLNHTGPGNSVYSMELLPLCGFDKSSPACDITPTCIADSPLCAPPRWSEYRSGWVRVETRESAAQRYKAAAESLVRTATYLTRCTDEDGSVIEDCTPVRWPEGPQSAACAMLASSIWESGYREDIMIGAPPAGRGPDGEACVMQVMPQHIAANVSWLSEDQRLSMSTEDIAKMVLGSDRDSLKRCYEAGGRMLAKFRAHAGATCKGTTWAYSMYSAYGTGGQCSPSTTRAALEKEKLETQGRVQIPVGDKDDQKPKTVDWAAQREKTYNTCMNRWPDGEKLPDWAEAI